MSKPLAELDRCKYSGHPVLRFHRLRPAQVEVLRSVMLCNGNTELHEARSLAMAHLGPWDTQAGRAEIWLHSEEQGHIQMFLSMMRDKLGINIPHVPQSDYQ